MKKIPLILLIFAFPLSITAQTGGNNVYEFLNLTHSGLISSLGGSNVSLPAANINTAWHNPALLSNEMRGDLALNFTSYFAGINYGLAMYAPQLKNDVHIAAGISYLNYGDFTQADASGNITGTFRASESAASFIYSCRLDSSFTTGVSVKPVFSSLDKYNSFGIAVDLGASWHSRNNLLSAGLVLRNIGCQLTKYAGEQRGKPPFEIMAGITVKPEHAPLRFSFTLRHLEKYDLIHDYPATESRKSEFADNLMRHIVIGTEIIPHRNFYISAGFNHQRRSELATGSKTAGSGLSWGFGFNSARLNIEFGRASYHLAGISNHFTVIIKPDMFRML